MANLKNAVRDGDLKLIQKLLIQEGQACFCRWSAGYTLLKEAAHHGHINIAEVLITYGARVNATATHTDTPLHFAVVHADLQLIRLLIDKGTDVNVENSEGKTPLHVAVCCNIYPKHLKIIKTLLKSGVDANRIQEAFIAAVRQNDMNLINHFLEYGFATAWVISNAELM